MATFTTRTIASLRREFVIPAADPRGAAAAEIGKAWSAADKAYREAHGLAENVALSDEALRFTVTDDEIVITFTTEEPRNA